MECSAERDHHLTARTPMADKRPQDNAPGKRRPAAQWLQPPPCFCLGNVRLVEDVTGWALVMAPYDPMTGQELTHIGTLNGEPKLAEGMVLIADGEIVDVAHDFIVFDHAEMVMVFYELTYNPAVKFRVATRVPDRQISTSEGLNFPACVLSPTIEPI